MSRRGHAGTQSAAPRRRSRSQFGRARRRSFAKLAEFVLEHADLCEISMRATSPGTRYLGGLKPMPTPAGVPVAMMSPGISVTPAEMVAMMVGTSKMRSRVLAFCRSSPLIQHRILGVGQIDLVPGHRPRTHRAERVLRLADEPLAVSALQIARRHIVDDGVAPDVIERARRLDAASALPDDDAEFGFVVDRFGDGPVDPNDVAMRDDAFGDFREDDRVFRRDAGRRAGIEAARCEFFGVLVVVLADAKDVSPRPRDRRFEARPRSWASATDRAARGSRPTTASTPHSASASERSNADTVFRRSSTMPTRRSPAMR